MQAMTDAEKSLLLRIARQSITSHLTGSPPPDLSHAAVGAGPFGGAFVTLHNHGQLRGCIGTFHPRGGIVETIAQCAIDVTHDPRFLVHPVTAAELGDLDIEISILSALQRAPDPLALELGKHGIYIRRGPNIGCFLPQVATDHPEWTKEEFLTRCSHDKARLPADAWRDPQTEVFLFTAEIFGEHDVGASWTV
jgi:AmmeMemoRadiSam system protein A